MNGFLNYLLEASIGLCLFLLVYHLMLRKETSFRLSRTFLLIAVIASITFPLIKLNTINSPVPSLNFSIEYAESDPTAELQNGTIPEDASLEWGTWDFIFLVYGIGVIIFSCVFVIRFFRMIKALKQSPKYKYIDHNIVELKGGYSPFSFFNYIFINDTPPLSENEKQQIIEHESIHIKLYHSADILLLNILGIIFWFNPVIRVYKNTFIQLHEFEADARAVEKHDVNEYCSLLAKVALHSADFKLANHFSNSLTIKRINMMRTLKRRVQGWKIIACTAVIPIFFCVVACQDQAENQYTEVEVLKQSVEYPQKVQDALIRLKKESPDDKFVVLPPFGGKLKDYDLDESAMEDGARPDVLTIITSDIKDVNNNPMSYIIFQYKSKNKQPATEDEVVEVEVPVLKGVFTVVEEPPTYQGGTEKIAAFISQNLRYPEKAKSENIEGSVYVSFIIEPDGSVQEAKVIKGIDAACDAEAIRIIKLMNNWNPGKQNGKAVRTQFVLPVKFKL